MFGGIAQRCTRGTVRVPRQGWCSARSSSAASNYNLDEKQPNKAKEPVHQEVPAFLRPSDILSICPKTIEVKSLRYPILLCHGMGGDKPFLKYFRTVPEDLESAGIKVRQTDVWRYGSVYKRASLLENQVRATLDHLGVKKLNLIAHSMGGLDARYFIANMGGHEYVESLVTIGTPHRGSAYCDWCIQNVVAPSKVDLWGKHLPWEIGAWNNLTTHYLRDDFNPKTRDVDGVSYYSIAGVMTPTLINPLTFSYNKLHPIEGANDGLVSVHSAMWGTFLGTVPLDHKEQIGWSLIDPRPFFRRIANHLAEQGH